MKVFNKLVRDKIPDIIEKNNEIPVTRVLDNSDYFDALNKKLKEEVNEYLEDNETEELCDIVEVIYAILNYKGVTLDEFEKIRIGKVTKRGGFNKRIYLERTFSNEKK